MRKRNKPKRRKGDIKMTAVKEMGMVQRCMSSYKPAKTRDVAKILLQYNRKHDAMMKKLAKL
jgi:hypothetical protein